MTHSKAIKLRSLIEQAATSLPDKEASEGVELFPSLQEDGSLVSVGTRINWNGVVKKAATDLWDTAANNPDNAPNLWADLAYKDGYRFIPEVISASAAFSLGERGWWNDQLYESLLAANVYTPSAYPAGWKLV